MAAVLDPLDEERRQIEGDDFDANAAIDEFVNIATHDYNKGNTNSGSSNAGKGSTGKGKGKSISYFNFNQCLLSLIIFWEIIVIFIYIFFRGI